MKLLLITSTLLILLTGCPTNPAVQYPVGGEGPAGGIIFYDDEADGTDDIPGYRYLEAAPEDLSINAITTFIFGFYKDSENAPQMINGTSTEIGTGQENTTLIVQAMGNNAYSAVNWGPPAVITGDSTGSYAAKLCDDYELNEYDDWFLPSLDELHEMYEQLHQNNLGSFTADLNYWSSSEVNRENGYIKDFDSTPESTQSGKGGTHYVRPVRMF
jgi:hypothetical protein